MIMPGAAERLADWTVRSLRAANLAAKDREAPFFAALAAISIPLQDYYAAAVFAACMLTCHYLARYPLNKGPLPTRKRFLKSVPQTRASGECPVCYDEADVQPQFACCGNRLCNDCIQLVFGPDHRDNRCPTCREPLFQTRAPWNNTAIKVACCRSLVGLIECAVDVATRVLDRSPKSRLFNTLLLLVSAGFFIFWAWALIKMWSKMNADSASFWRLVVNDMAMVAFWPTFLGQIFTSAPGIDGKIQRLVAPEYDGVKDLIVIEG